MRGPGRDEHLRRGTPHHHETIESRALLEVPHVLAQLLRQLPLVLAAFDVRPLQALHIVLVEHGRHRLDVLEEILDRLEVLMPVEDAGFHRGGEGVIGNRIPRHEHEIHQVRERHEVLDLRRALLGALAEADRRHLAERADREGAAAPHILHAGNERRGHGAEAHQHHAQFSRRRRDLACASRQNRRVLQSHQCPLRRAAAIPGTVSCLGTGVGSGAPRATRATCTTRWITVIAETSASTATIQNSTTPGRPGPAPKTSAGTPRNRMRSARGAMPTLFSTPSASARARVYDTKNEATSATSPAAMARGFMSGGNGPVTK